MCVSEDLELHLHATAWNQMNSNDEKYQLFGDSIPFNLPNPVRKSTATTKKFPGTTVLKSVS
jgi:hypothetical protein